MVAALFGLGAAFFGLHYLPGVRSAVVDWLLEDTSKFWILGCLVTGIAFLLGFCFYAIQRGTYLRLEMDGTYFSVDAPLMQARIGQFWEEEFPELEKPSEVYFSQQKIEVITRGELEDLELVEKRLSKLLSKEFGYKRPFYITLQS